MQPSTGGPFSTDLFLPRGHSFLWQPELLFLEVVANVIIGGACLALVRVLYSRPHSGASGGVTSVRASLAAFACALALSQWFDVWLIWFPDHWLGAALHGVTAVSAVAAVISARTKLDSDELAPERGDIGADRKQVQSRPFQ